MSIIYNFFFYQEKMQRRDRRYLSENTATADVLISLMAYIPLQRILGLSFGMKAVLKSATYLVQWES